MSLIIFKSNSIQWLILNKILYVEIAVVSYEADEAVQAAKRIPLENETLPFYLEKLDSIAQQNNGYFALGKLTWADMYFTAVLDYLNYMAKRNLTEGYPNLQKVVDNVLSVDAIKKWVETRPKTEL